MQCTRKNKGVIGTSQELLLVNPARVVRRGRRKVLLSAMQFINMVLLNNDSRKVQ